MRPDQAYDEALAHDIEADRWRVYAETLDGLNPHQWGLLPTPDPVTNALIAASLTKRQAWPAPSPATRHDAPAFYGHAWPAPAPAKRKTPPRLRWSSDKGYYWTAPNPIDRVGPGSFIYYWPGAPDPRWTY